MSQFGFNHRCTLSSHLLIMNIIYLYMKDDPIYFYSFVILFCTSILNHTTNNKIIRIIDKIAVYNVVYQGGTRFYKEKMKDESIKDKSISVLVVFFFLSCIYFYFYGAINNIIGIKTSAQLEPYYHCITHLSGALGHLLIIYKISKQS